jgi:hypothetical protein
MSSNHLTLRLNREESLLIERLRDSLGLTKSDLVKRALRQLADQASAGAVPAVSLYTLGEGRFGQHADATRQSRHIKAIVRERVKAKRAA